VWNKALGAVAESADDVAVVDLWTDWPRAAAERGALTLNGWHLSDQGHARVAAAVCDALISR
jgi:lysophospholipase L1-like esterase